MMRPTLLEISSSNIRRAAALAITLCAAAAHAGDGRLEINAVCALETGCFEGDGPGVPVTITESGSYVLTGDLYVPIGSVAQPAIRLDAALVNLDLNGFEISGPFIGNGGGGIAASGTGLDGSFATIKNGTLGTIAGTAIDLGDAEGVRVEDVTILGAGGGGISVGPGSLVLHNVVSNATTFGIQIDRDALIRDNTVRSTSGGSDVVFRNGRDTGSNVCEDNSCRVRPAGRRFYMTPLQYVGNAVGTACAAGFHIAAFNEIRDRSGYEYDPVLGDSGSTPYDPPPQYGWLGSGCSGWSSTGGTGQVGGWETDIGNGGESRWVNYVFSCTTSERVWCVEN